MLLTPFIGLGAGTTYTENFQASHVASGAALKLPLSPRLTLASTIQGIGRRSDIHHSDDASAWFLELAITATYRFD